MEIGLHGEAKDWWLRDLSRGKIGSYMELLLGVHVAIGELGEDCLYMGNGT